jgi:phosphate transport system protein
MEENLHVDQHISQRFNDELEDLRGQVLAMGGLVEAQCRNAVTALKSGDRELAETVATSDYKVNDIDVAVNAACIDILARRQPAASDLRMILAVIRMSADLERIGDEAEKIGRMAVKLAEAHDKHAILSDSQHLGASVTDMLHRALDAFARLDVQTAVEVAARDPDINRDFDALTRVLITHMMEEPRAVKTLLQVNWCARALERIGDHAVNICEEVVFLVKGDDVRHVSLEELRKQYQA